MRTVTIFFLLSAVATLGCGKKGQLIPPEALVPDIVQNLLVRQKGEDLRISWQAPVKEQGGRRPLRDLAGFRLLRRDLADGNNCPSCPDSWQLLTFIDLDLPGETKQSGSTFLYFDRKLPLGSISQYRLLALSRSGASSLPAVSPPRKMLPPVSAPAIKAAQLPSSIRINFTFTLPQNAKLLGFNVYRRLDSETTPLLPLNSAPLPQSGWEDQQLQFGQRYHYSATALVEIAGETVESLASEETELLFSLQDIR